MSKNNRKTKRDKIQSQKRTAQSQTVEAIEEKERRAKQAAEEEHAKILAQSEEVLPVKIMRIVLSIWVFLILVGVPLYVHDAYNDIGTSKWNFYSASTFGFKGETFTLFVPGCLIIALFVLIAYMVWCLAYGVFKDVFSLKKLRIPDYCVIAFMFFATLSAILAQDKSVVLWGFPQWYMGLMAQLSFGALYFFISRFYRKRWCVIFAITCAMASLAIVGSVAMCNRYGYDVLGLYKATWGDSWWNTYYISTLTQGSWDSVWMVLMTAIAVYLFWGCEHIAERIVGLFLTALGAAGCLATDAASAFLGIMVLVTVVFFCSFSSYKRLLRFFETVLTMLVSWQVMRIVSEHMPEEHKLNIHIESMILYLIQGEKMKTITMAIAVITVAGWIVAVISWFRNKRAEKPESNIDTNQTTTISKNKDNTSNTKDVEADNTETIAETPNPDKTETVETATIEDSEKPTGTRVGTTTSNTPLVLRIAEIIVYIIFAAGIILGVIYLILNTKKLLPERFLSDNGYLVLDINWGTWRARMWNVILRGFREKIANSPMLLFFGFGPDSLYQVFNDLSPELDADWQVAAQIFGVNESKYLVNAHNEWLTMLVDLGILGGTAHLMTFITSAVRFAKNQRKNTLLVMSLSAVVAYMATTFITYQHALGAPFIWLLMGIGAGVALEMEKNKAKNSTQL